MAGERRYHTENDFYRPFYKNLTLARKDFTFPDQQRNAVPAIQPELSSEQNPPPSRVKADLERAMTKSIRSKYANETDETTTSHSSSQRKARSTVHSPVISKQPTPRTNSMNLAMDQTKVSKLSGIHDNSDDLDSSTPASLLFETSTYSSFKPSPSRDSSYSPPPSKPKAPKRTLGAVAKAKGPIPPVLGKRTTKKRPSYSPSLTPSMLYAPWNDHQSGMGDSALLSTSEYQVELSDSEVDHPIKRARRNSLLPESTKLCDNYGCNAMHSHLDCPLGMKCWGCRANTHYTSACPMTCVECGFAGHARKFCEDFEIDTRAGIPRPKRHTVQPASADTKLPAMSSEKTYQCDNYPCQELHSHYDCPLPTTCWGCRATDHFWSGCHARCGKCGAERHISKYCNEFEFWMNGKSRPKRSPDEMRRIVSMKRQRQIEMQQVEESNQQQHGLYPKSQSVTSSTPLQPPMKRRASSSSHEQSQFTPKGSRPNEHATSLGAHHEQTTRSQAIPTQPRITRNHFPMLEHGPNGEKVYCTYWLRTGSCRFSTVGCALKHRVPAEKSLQDGIGIDFHSPWLQDDPVVREYHKKDRGALRPSDRRSGEHGQHELNQQSPLTATHKWVQEPRGNQKPIKTSTTPMLPSAREPPTQPAKHVQPAKQSIHDLFKSLDPPSDISEPFSEPRKSSISKCKTPITAKEPRLLTSESRHQPTTQTESRSISPYQTTNLTKTAAPIAPRAIPESLAEMVDAGKKKDAEKKKDVDRKPTTAKEAKISSNNPTHTTTQSPAPRDPAPLAAPTTESTLAAKLKAFEEEEFFRQRRHEAEMVRKKEELRLVYEHEKMMAELRRG